MANINDDIYPELETPASTDRILGYRPSGSDPMNYMEAGKLPVSTPQGAAITSAVSNHAALTAAHGATASPTPDRIALRDAEGVVGVAGVNFDTAATPTQVAGGLYWDEEEKAHTSAVSATESLTIGSEMTPRYRNATGSTLTQGEVVYVDGAVGSNTTVARAQADALSTSRGTIGIVTDDAGIANNQRGRICTLGRSHNHDTSAWVEGTELWLSPTVAGGMTSTEPTTIGHLKVLVGTVERQHATQGVINVDPHFYGSVTGEAVLVAATKADARVAIDAASIIADNAGKAIPPTQLEDRTIRQRAASLAASTDAFNSAASFVEDWTDLSNWTTDGVAGVQVSGGRLYSTGSGGSQSGANHAFVAGTTGHLRAVFNLTLVAGATSGGVVIGVSDDTAGGDPANSAANARGLFFRGTNTNVQSVDNGSFSDIAGPIAVSAGTYVVTVTADENYLSIVAVKTDNSLELRTRFTRGSYSINNLYIFNSDSRALSGHSIGMVGGKLALATVEPAAGIEDVGPTIHWSGDGTNNYKLHLPPGFDSRTSLPVLIAFHGNGSNENHFADHANSRRITNAFRDAGYAVLTAAYGTSTTTWGAQPSLDAYVAAYEFFAAHYPLGPVVLHGQSMGGLESLLVLASQRIPGVVVWTGCVPATSLLSAYDGGFTSVITAAYGISGDYAEATAGHDPQLMPGYAFRGLPMWSLVATDDVSVPYDENMEIFASQNADYSPVFTVVETTGGHGVSYSAFTAELVEFCAPYVAYAETQDNQPSASLPVYTVATLPKGYLGRRACVTDATAPTYNGALTGGGAVRVPVFYNGSAWVSA